MRGGGESARRALAGDAPDIASLAIDYVAALAQARGGEALISRVRRLVEGDSVASLIRDTDGSRLIVGLFDGVIAGFAHAVVREEAGEHRRVEVEAIYIGPQWRRVGIGEAMIGEIARYAGEEDAQVIDVVALPGDGATKSFLEATGFRARLLVMQRATSRG